MTHVREQAPAIYYQCQPEEDSNLKYVNVREFDLCRSINKLQGQPTLEIAGPTRSGYPIIDNRLPSAPIVTNIKPFKTETENVDLLADFKQLPIRTESVGVVLASAIPMYEVENDDPASARYLRRQALAAYSSYLSFGGPASPRQIEKNQRLGVIEESARILVKDGLLVWQNGSPEDVEVAEVNGLQLARIGHFAGHSTYPDGEQVEVTSVQCVFQKR